MKCVVTGAAGFIGRHLNEWQVVGIDKVVPEEFCKQIALEARPLPDQMRMFAIDITCDLDHADFEDADVVFHLAAMTSPNECEDDPDQCIETNVTGTARVIRRAIEEGVPRVVLASLAEVSLLVGNQKPWSELIASKLAAEGVANVFDVNRAIEVLSLRYCNVIGPGQNPAGIPLIPAIEAVVDGRSLSLEVFGLGMASRSWLSVHDCCRLTRIAGNAFVGDLSMLEIAGPECLSVRQVVEMVENIIGRELPKQVFDIPPHNELLCIKSDDASLEATARLLGTPEWTVRRQLEEIFAGR